MAAPLDLDGLYDDHGQALFAFLLNLTRSEGDTRDLLQEVFLKLAARPGLLDGVRDERGFLLRLGHNLAVDLIRRREARQRAHNRLAGGAISLFAPSADPGDAFLRKALSEALGELPADQRAVVHLNPSPPRRL